MAFFLAALHLLQRFTCYCGIQVTNQSPIVALWATGIRTENSELWHGKCHGGRVQALGTIKNSGEASHEGLDTILKNISLLWSDQMDSKGVYSQGPGRCQSPQLH